MTEGEPEKETRQKRSNHIDEEIEIDLMGILRGIMGTRKTIYKAASIGLVMGITIALSVPKQYTVTVTLSPEMGTSKKDGLPGLAISFLGSGVAMGDGTDALNASLSADIVSSTPFLLELSTMKVQVTKNKAMTLDTHLDEESSLWWNYAIGFPGMVIGGVKLLFTEEDELTPSDQESRDTIELSKKELGKIKALRNMIIASIGKKISMTPAAVTLQSPKVTIVVADSVVKKLQEYIIGYRASRPKEDCLHLERLFKERQQECYTAQQKYTDYLDSHDNIILQGVRVEQKRLQSDMNLAYQVYNQMVNQLQVARVRVQEGKPVFATVEPAVVSPTLSGTSMRIHALAFVFLLVCAIIFWNLFGKDFLNKFKEIRV